MDGTGKDSAAFTDRILRTIRAHDMMSSGSRVLIGFSGGPDSTALARVLMALAPGLGITIGLAHLNHGLRGPEADRDEAFSREFADRHGLEFHGERLDVRALATAEKRSVEEAGRMARYAFFKRIVREKNYHRTALGHHRDDHTEQVLLNLIRGTGPAGLKGIAPKRGDGIIRPLIQVSKAEILAYLEALDQPFVTDASNDDPAFLRNRVRHRLIPLMEEGFNPDIRTCLDRLSQIMAREDDFIEGEAEKRFKTLVTDRADREITLALPGLLQSHSALAGRIIRMAIRQVKQDLRRITHGHVTDILDLAGSSEPGKHLDLPGQVRVYRLRKGICFRKEALPLRTLGQRGGKTDIEDHQA